MDTTKPKPAAAVAEGRPMLVRSANDAAAALYLYRVAPIRAMSRETPEELHAFALAVRREIEPLIPLLTGDAQRNARVVVGEAKSLMRHYLPRVVAPAPLMPTAGASGPSRSVPVRFPAWLRDAINREATSQGQPFAEYVREAALMRLQASWTTYVEATA